ncbi:MAG: thiamine-phosphate kinase [Candidatus Omnitrophica bacterium]|nr:thiamine-phosphate kinase [Candidatus Omnitrophota bacterium]
MRGERGQRTRGGNGLGHSALTPHTSHLTPRGASDDSHLAPRRISDVGEIGLIRRLARRLPTSSEVLVGIGDDTAVLRWRHAKLLFASDILVEGTHFRVGELPAEWIGWKALARNVSDIAAMGGQPVAAVISLGLPRATPVGLVDGIYRGLARCAKRFRLAIVGGDTVRSPVIVVDVAIVGWADRPIQRSGARVGDIVCVTGRLGGSLASGRHARFIPRLEQAQWLARHVPVHAMIDVSDGLVSDLRQLARASRVTFRIDESAVPVRRDATLRQALMDGEDFELLFTVAPSARRRILPTISGIPITRIGSVVRHGSGVEGVGRDGRLRPLVPDGFQHF